MEAEDRSVGKEPRPPRLSLRIGDSHDDENDDDDSFYLAAEAMPVSRLPLGNENKENAGHGEIAGGLDESHISIGKSPEGARRVIPNRRTSFGDFRLDGFDISDLGIGLGLGPEAAANLSGVFDRLGEDRTKAAFAQLDKLRDGE